MTTFTAAATTTPGFSAFTALGRVIVRVDLVGGRTPKSHVKVDPLRLEGWLSLNQMSDALPENNLIGAAGLHAGRAIRRIHQHSG